MILYDIGLILHIYGEGLLGAPVNNVSRNWVIRDGIIVGQGSQVAGP